MPTQNEQQMMATRRGVTLLEVFVVIGIIAIIVALVAPAIQSVRESMRRAQCQSNLRQVLLASQGFHSANGTLPSLYNGTSLAYPLSERDLFHTHSWRVPLLPHLEQSALRQRVVWEELATEPANAAVAQTVVPVYLCPTGSDPAEDMGRGLRHSMHVVPPESVPSDGWYNVVRSDYDAMAGTQVFPEPFPVGENTWSVDFIHWGVWGRPYLDNNRISGGRLLRYRAGTFRDITDGLSNTIAVVERGGKPTDFMDGEPNITPFDPDAEYPGQVGWSASNTFLWAINRHDIGVNKSNSLGIYSLHPGGANVAMADGSVRFLSEATASETLVEMFSRSGGP